MVPSSDAVQNQDGLRVLRAFVGAVAGYTSDQSFAGDDGTAYNPTGQFTVLGPQGAVTEGQPTLRTTTTNIGGFAVPTSVILIAVGVAIAIAVKKLA